MILLPRISLHILLSLFHDCAAFSSARYFHSLSDPAPPLFLPLLTMIMRFFLPETRCRFYLFAIATCFFFLSRHDVFTFFFHPRIGDTSAVSLEGVIRGYGNTRIREKRCNSEGRREKYKRHPRRIRAILKGFFFFCLRDPCLTCERRESTGSSIGVVIRRGISREVMN